MGGVLAKYGEGSLGSSSIWRFRQERAGGTGRIRTIQLHRLKCYTLWILEFRKISTLSN